MAAPPRFELLIPSAVFDSMLRKPKDLKLFQVNKLERVRAWGASASVHSEQRPYTDAHVTITGPRTDGSLSLVASAAGARVVVPERFVDVVDFLQDRKNIKLLGKFEELKVGVPYTVHDNTIVRTPDAVLVINTPEKAAVRQALSDGVQQANPLPAVFAYSQQNQ